MSSKVTASVTDTRLRLSVVLVDAVTNQESVLPTASYIAPIAATISVIPAANISYISIVFSADIDVSGLFSYKIDSVALTDGKAITMTKAPSESFVIIDGFVYALNKSISDSASLFDLVTKTCIFIRNFAEVQSVADSSVKNIAKLLSDNAIPADAVAFGITKTKQLVDGFAMNDSAESSDGLTFSFSISVSNVIFTSDGSQRSFVKTRTESVGTADAGFILQQDYVDLTYFSEDYVGVGYTF